MDRRRFLTISTLGAAGMMAGCNKGTQQPASPPAGAKAAAPASPFSFTMNVLDGYAYLFAKGGGRLVLGGLDHAGMKHPLKVRVLRGTVAAQTAIVPVQDVFDLTGWHAVVDLDSPLTGLTVPADSLAAQATANVACAVKTAADWNDLAWLPPVSKIYADATVKTDWAAELDSRMVIERGNLAVMTGPDGLWEFKASRTAAPVLSQPMSDRVKIEAPLNGKVARLKLYKRQNAEPAAGAAPEATLEISAPDGIIVLDVATSFPAPAGQYVPGDPVPHFARFKRLVTTASAYDILPYFKACPSELQHSPGEFCPFIRCEIPA
jgi:hypothetical protein